MREGDADRARRPDGRRPQVHGPDDARQVYRIPPPDVLFSRRVLNEHGACRFSTGCGRFLPLSVPAATLPFPCAERTLSGRAAFPPFPSSPFRNANSRSITFCFGSCYHQSAAIPQKMEVLPHDGTFFAVVFRVLAGEFILLRGQTLLQRRKKIGASPLNSIDSPSQVR